MLDARQTPYCWNRLAVGERYIGLDGQIYRVTAHTIEAGRLVVWANRNKGEGKEREDGDQAERGNGEQAERDDGE